MDYLKTFLRHRQFPPALQRKIIEHEEFLWAKGQGVNEDRLFDNLPISLKQEVCNHMFLEFLDKIPIFKDTESSFKFRLVRVMQTLVLPPSFFVCRFGETGEEMYFIRSGEVEVLSPNLDKVYVVLGAGSFFGEVVLFDSASKRTATIRTKTTTELCVLNKDAFHQILKLFPETEAVLLKLVEERKNLAAQRALNQEKEHRAEISHSSLQRIRASVTSLHESTTNAIKEIKTALSASFNGRLRRE